MANFIIVIDPDPQRRSHFIQTIEPLLPPVEGLITNSCSTGDFQAIWAANPNAPISCISDRDGAAVIWGEAIIQSESTRIDAPGLKTLWKDSHYKSLPPFDGYYAAVVYQPHFHIAVGADILGLFPIYYYTCGDVLLVGSSQELFRYHPLFKTEFNPAGLVGILLTNGLFNGQTLWQNVRRLDAGHLLLWQPEAYPKEIKQYEIPGSSQHNPYGKLTFSEHLDIIEQSLEKAFARHAPVGERYALLFSGGLDSRMIAGFLQKQGIDLLALTLGIPSDIEMECAISVARALGLEHHTANIPLKQYPSYADILAKWEHLANGCNCIMDWGIPFYLQDYAAKAIAGYTMDVLVGGPAPVTNPNENLSFELFFKRSINNVALSPQFLERLLRKEVFGDLVQDTLAHIQNVYESYSDIESRRSWWFELYHRQRFHTAGVAAWQLCFGSWPILPILDWQLLNTSAVLPEETMGRRRAQIELVRTRFRQLAALPLDRNDYLIEPLQPSKIRRRLARLFRLQVKWRRWQRKLGLERRYYYRTYDINNAGWRAVRRQAEPYRERVQHLFHQDVLNELLPPPDVPVRCGYDPIPESSGIKLLIGILLWSRDNL